MEKYGQYRDKGSGIAPFFAISPPPSSPLLFPWHVFLFCVRIPLNVIAWVIWLSVVQWLPAGSMLRKANQWCLLGIPGVWWMDIQVDGVRRGALAKGSQGRVPGPGTIIAASFTSPLDVLYLAAIFDPIFTIGQPGSREVLPVSLEGALAYCFHVHNPLALGTRKELTKLSKLTAQNPFRVIVVFPEGTTSNGRGILRFTQSLLSAAKDTRIFPISLRYTPADVVTPMPGWLEIATFIWQLNSRQTHYIRVRIGSPITISSIEGAGSEKNDALKTNAKTGPGQNGYETNFFDTLKDSSPRDDEGDEDSSKDHKDLKESERRLLDTVADSLARLGRVKRVGLGLEEKAKFVQAWTKKRS